MQRQDVIRKMESGTGWDVIVIGGGATGLGIALEASSRGYSCLLLEQSDFAKATSSKSTKLIHGGVRYLAQGNIALVREASLERGLLFRNAPHLVKDQSFLLPVYTYIELLKFTIGLKLYDWISGRSSIGPSVFISRKKTLERLPNLHPAGILGAVQYHDGRFDDARLAVNLAQSVFDAGGFAINYMQVTGLLKDDAGFINGVDVKDMESGGQYRLNAKAVINATGVFADDILQMDASGASRLICASQGVHIVLDKKFLASDEALMIPETPDGRILFAVPWHNKVVVGTTDIPVKQVSLEPVAMEKEIDFILATASRYLLHKPVKKDILSVYAGLRPLAAPQGERKKTKEISRSHVIRVSDSNLFTMLGGKWTTYRKMGQDMIDHVEKKLHWPPATSVTASLHIHGFSNDLNAALPFHDYGSDAAGIIQLMEEHPDGWISKTLGIHQAQVTWAVKEEMARTVDDVLSRRTRALLLDARESVRMSVTVATMMARLLHKDQQWINEQVMRFKEIAGNYILEETT
jgi:glycerol-3-phosphate dehydrogenase